ncbi:multicopper oxidase domain-containing protein [Thermomonospora cellulosilytica]|uniref:Multicopper oxidase CueO n=1 Tax=Thermomonospora cellulosilytica TaxID=1411118 RepID=A0A7W3N0W8_9ACTN|nr:multicopper oxidase domain-containing protein [Thermomonospora cellulosilytica]MBA9005500.1 FtsP/CotA-like multicopper oxidase with cupredoxin domain [Thermomonospora cellulosilytica]
MSEGTVMLSRRNLIKYGTAGGAAALVPVTAPLVGLTARENTGEVAPPEPFTVPLAVPPVLRPVARSSSTDYYEITMRHAEAEILPGVRTQVMAYNGLFPGPTIRATSGRRVVVKQTNAMHHDAVVHLHGGIVAPEHDGHPMDVIAPGQSRTYVYPNRQPGATLWYHDHTHHMEAEMVFRGLAGVYIVEDRSEAALRLPSGPYDVPLMLRDARFDDQGQLVFELGDFRNRNVQLVNGRVQPYFQVAARKYRLRFVNGANERYYQLKLGDDEEMVQVASDGGLLPRPVPTTRITMSPGERVDVVVDFSRYPLGTRLVLANADPDTTDIREIMRFDVVRPAKDDSRLPGRLRPMYGRGRGKPGAVDRERDISFYLDLEMQHFVIDGKHFDPDRIDMQVRKGDVEVWTIHNRDDQFGIPHNFHVHGVHFEVLERNGQPVSGHEAGWKDTVAVPIGGNVRVRVRFDDYRGRYLYHCHLIDHSTMGMMAQLEVVD